MISLQNFLILYFLSLLGYINNAKFETYVIVVVNQISKERLDNDKRLKKIDYNSYF